MAKEPKKTTAFGTPPTSFNESRRQRRDDVPTHTDTHKHTHTQTDGMQEPQARARKTKRIQILTYESLIERMDAYAARKGVGRVDVFEAAVTAFLDQVEGADT